MTALAQEIERQSNAKRDFIAATEHVQMRVAEVEAVGDVPATKRVEMAFGNNAMPAKLLAHEQVAEHTGVPVRYYKRMLSEAPELLATNVGEWFRRYPAPRMLRTLDGNVRAFLSDRYRPLENHDLAEAILPVLGEMGLDIMSSQITDTRLYIKAIDSRVKRDMPTGKKWGDGSHIFFDTVSPAIVISNSEVGCGALSIEAGVYTKICTNLAVASSRSMKRYHLGGKQELGESIVKMLSEDTRRTQDAALWKTVRDVTRAAFDEAAFDAYLSEVKGTADNKIEGDPVKAVDLAAKRFGINEGEKASVLRHLIAGGDLSQYGLHAAVTRAAEDLQDYDRASDFERLGGKVLELPKAAWKEIALAA